MLLHVWLQQVDTTLLGLSMQEAVKLPYIASMGVYVFRTDVLLKLLKCSYPTCNDFGSEIIPSAVKHHNVQVWYSPNWNSSIILFLFHSVYIVCELCFNMVIKLLRFRSVLHCQAYLFNDYWEDIGTIESFFYANLALTEQVDITLTKNFLWTTDSFHRLNLLTQANPYSATWSNFVL